ncbi:hypothetical protein DU508_16300 [Pedobacter chinensis]|uniref:Glycine transferase n=1 Tax=Pedobacter chinensis TaxID=2282421 RepID=A0A369PT40_9SPHI|nr:WbqC family protein [Pedobacter chinensis]RDC55821.1 hypothetical protein DU508_16300 [Pedobacter chinensis]
MRLGIMQPYVFPYIGYYQLISSVDKFIIYDDVNYIKQGWINRNQFLLNHSAFKYVIPLKEASSFKHIADTFIDPRSYPHWCVKFFKTLEQAYRRAPFYDQVLPLIKNCFLELENFTINELASNSLKKTSAYLNIDTTFAHSNNCYANEQLSGQERIIDICLKENAETYMNAVGGQQLYSFNDFSTHKIDLVFLKTGEITYTQFNGTFIAGLSMIDVLMFNSAEQISKMLKTYNLITA